MTSEKHWSDEQLIDHLYGVGPADRHLSDCAKCRDRLDTMQAARRDREACYQPEEALRPEVLAAQRRAIYRRIDRQAALPWWSIPRRAWASAALALTLVVGGLTVYRDPQLFQRRAPEHSEPVKVSDAQLADQVGQIADNTEPEPAAPLEALFED
jgi:predicted anti-sigma-YlaC factor YlaD